MSNMFNKLKKHDTTTINLLANKQLKSWIDYFVKKIDETKDPDTKEVLKEYLKMYLDLSFRPRMITSDEIITTLDN